jgi:hypothetical protein
MLAVRGILENAVMPIPSNHRDCQERGRDGHIVTALRQNIGRRIVIRVDTHGAFLTGGRPLDRKKTALAVRSRGLLSTLMAQGHRLLIRVPRALHQRNNAVTRSFHFLPGKKPPFQSDRHSSIT